MFFLFYSLLLYIKSSPTQLFIARHSVYFKRISYETFMKRNIIIKNFFKIYSYNLHLRICITKIGMETSYLKMFVKKR